MQGAAGAAATAALCGLALLLTSVAPAGALLFSVELRVPRYVPQGGSALLRCDYSVQWDALHKVEWLQGNRKLLQFVRNRRPPFRYFGAVGAVVDRNQSNEREVLLRDLTLHASGYYSCEVSTQTPIFTKASNDEEITVFKRAAGGAGAGPQRGSPRLRVRSQHYSVGELLEANCTSRPAHPVPHLTWLLNGDTVPDSFVRFFPAPQPRAGDHLGSGTVQLSVPLQLAHARASGGSDGDGGSDGGSLRLACVATLPAFLGPRVDERHYADYEKEEISVEVIVPEMPRSVLDPAAGAGAGRPPPGPLAAAAAAAAAAALLGTALR